MSDIVGYGQTDPDFFQRDQIVCRVEVVDERLSQRVDMGPGRAPHVPWPSCFATREAWQAHQRVCDAALAEYRRHHSVCPQCGAPGGSRTCLGHIPSDPTDWTTYRDLNRTGCSAGCGWSGTVHDLVCGEEGE